MTRSRPGDRAKNGKIILDYFKELYFVKNGKKYDVNYGMIVMCEKLGNHYTFPQIIEIMNYYFKHKTGNFYEFVDSIDVYKKNMERAEEQKIQFKELEDQTKEQIKKIKEKKVNE